LHSSMQTSADYRSRRRHVSRMTDEKGETWSPSGMSKVRSRPESLVADCSMHALQPLYSIDVVLALLVLILDIQLRNQFCLSFCHSVSRIFIYSTLWPTKLSPTFLLLCRVTTCLENLEMSGNLTAVQEVSGILLKIREMSEKILSG